MRHWIAVNLFLVALLLATVGAVFVEIQLVALLALPPLQERVLLSTAALVTVIAVGALFKRVLRRFAHRPSPALKT